MPEQMTQNKISDFGFKVFQIEINSSCNMQCSFCAYPLRSVPKMNMDLEQIKHIIDQAAEDGSLRFVAFQHYGEPLLHKSLFEAIDYAREKGVKSQVITNCLLLTDDIVDKLLTHSPDILRLSFHTTDQELYQNTRGSNLPFHEYRNRIERCAVKILTQRNNIKECRIDIACAPRIKSVTKKIKQKFFNQNPGVIITKRIEDIEGSVRSFAADIAARACLTFDGDQFKRNVSDYKKSCKSASVLYKFNDIMSLTVKRHIDGRRMFHNIPVQYGKCSTNTIGILPDGRITLCCLDCDGWTSIGNAFEDKIINLLRQNSDLISQIRKGPRIPFEPCQRCQGYSKRPASFAHDFLKRIHLR